MSELLLEKLAREVSDEEMEKIKRKYLGLGAGIGALIGGGAGFTAIPKITGAMYDAKFDKIMDEYKTKGSQNFDPSVRKLDHLYAVSNSPGLGAGIGAGLGAGAGTAIGNALARRKINKLLEK